MTSSSVDKPEESVASKPSMPAPASTTSEDQQNHSPPPSEEQRQSLPELRPQQPSEITAGRCERLSDPELSHIKMTTTTRTSIGVKLRLVHWACIVLIGITAGMGAALALETSAVGDPTIHSKPTFSFSALRLYLAISTRAEPSFLESSHRRAFLYTIIVSVSILFITIIINALRFETENISTWDAGQQCECMCSKRAVRANDIRAEMHPGSEMLQAARRLLAALQPTTRLRNGVIIQVQQSEEAVY